jgi:type 1 fimbriae regulatory protein FimE
MPNKKSEKNTGSKPLKRLKSTIARDREFLTDDEVERLIVAASKHEAFGLRNALMIRMSFRHGLRASELLDLQWDQIDLVEGTILIKRLKGAPEVQSLTEEELISLNTLAMVPKKSNFVFQGQKGSLFVDAFQLIVKKAGVAAKIGFPVHAHMLRHAKENKNC